LLTPAPCHMHVIVRSCALCVSFLCAGAAAAAAGASGGSSYLNLAQHSHQYNSAGTSLEALYGDTAVWINHHQGTGGFGGRGGAARMWRSAFSRRRY
jgi:hypothetical protein